MRLVIFDCDGTLVDSQHVIVACAQAAFRAQGLEPPAADAVRRIVGLSLVQALARLDPEGDPVRWSGLVAGYTAEFQAMRSRPDFDEPLFPGARELLETLDGRGVLMGVATGKAMRGLRRVLDHHDLGRYFVTLQTADLHPSKPHPAMVEAALAETGCAPEEAMLVGDTTFDIAMARAAGVLPVGVPWGNHPAEELRAAGARHMLDRFDDLLGLLPG